MWGQLGFQAFEDWWEGSSANRHCPIHQPCSSTSGRCSGDHTAGDSAGPVGQGLSTTIYGILHSSAPPPACACSRSSICKAHPGISLAIPERSKSRAEITKMASVNIPERNEFTMAWFYASPIEYTTAKLGFDRIFDDNAVFEVGADSTSYTLGQVGKHNIVMVVLTHDDYTPANWVKNLQATFPNVKLGLLVGMSDGAPSQWTDVRLGDVVVGFSWDAPAGLLQYNSGNPEADVPQDDFIKPPRTLSTAIFTLEYRRLSGKLDLHGDAQRRLQGCSQELSKQCVNPVLDRHTRSDMSHPKHENPPACSIAPPHGPENRSLREDNEAIPQVYYGTIASRNFLIGTAASKDGLSQKQDILCFVTDDAIELAKHLPCLAIRGVAKYADSHTKNTCHGYAALIAAAYTTSLLSEVTPSSGYAHLESVSDLASQMSDTATETLGGSPSPTRSRSPDSSWARTSGDWTPASSEADSAAAHELYPGGERQRRPYGEFEAGNNARMFIGVSDSDGPFGTIRQSFENVSATGNSCSMVGVFDSRTVKRLLSRN